MGEIFTVEDIRRNSGWREALEEKQAYESRRREIEEERERKARVPAEKQQSAATNNWDAWYAAIDARIKCWFDHYFDGLGKGNDYRGLYADEIAKGLAPELNLRPLFEQYCEETSRAAE